jgi:hypothetical protein
MTYLAGSRRWQTALPIRYTPRAHTKVPYRGTPFAVAAMERLGMTAQAELWCQTRLRRLRLWFTIRLHNFRNTQVLYVIWILFRL